MLRKATEKDIPRLVAIEQLTQMAPWSADIFERSFELRYDCWVIEVDQQVVAFLMMSSAMTGESHILNLCVDPACQRQGHGQQLLDYAISHARQHGFNMMYLEVRRSNHKAIRLYDKSGFVEIGTRKDYYPAKHGREDALIFAMDVSKSN
ncbi:MAG TPA: ribosomal protein S18-alanine N-acetyltransferase [Gammaproteobacteria bacterium]|nr:ribosomal protein S18-alanine N-acetyltransferase [Gammaproteobacteria bacterium]